MGRAEVARGAGAWEGRGRGLWGGQGLSTELVSVGAGVWLQVVSYAFYLAPLIMPMLCTMPPGRKGQEILETSVHITLLGGWLLPCRALRPRAATGQPLLPAAACLRRLARGQTDGGGPAARWQPHRLVLRSSCLPAAACTKQPLTAAPRCWRRAGMVMFLYVSCGFFGASLFGNLTAGNIMVNNFINSELLGLILYAGMLLYVSGGAVASGIARWHAAVSEWLRSMLHARMTAGAKAW